MCSFAHTAPIKFSSSITTNCPSVAHNFRPKSDRCRYYWSPFRRGKFKDTCRFGRVIGECGSNTSLVVRGSLWASSSNKWTRISWKLPSFPSFTTQSIIDSVPLIWIWKRHELCSIWSPRDEEHVRDMTADVWKALLEAELDELDISLGDLLYKDYKQYNLYCKSGPYLLGMSTIRSSFEGHMIHSNRSFPKWSKKSSCHSSILNDSTGCSSSSVTRTQFRVNSCKNSSWSCLVSKWMNWSPSLRLRGWNSQHLVVSLNPFRLPWPLLEEMRKLKSRGYPNEIVSSIVRRFNLSFKSISPSIFK